MNQHSPRAGLFDAKDTGKPSAAVLQGVQASGRLDGLFFELTVRQTYRNTGARNLEVVYTFPLPLDAVLLGLDVELGGKRLSGTVCEKRDAEGRYEAAIAEGDTPILLERSGDGLYTASLGNLMPGETAVLEYRYGQMVSFEHDRVRLCIPTVIAPRYGDAVRDGRLQGHQAPHTTLDAAHGFALTLDLAGEWAQAEVGCATHGCTTQPTPTGRRLALSDGAWLDRDVVVTLRPREIGSAASLVADGEGHVAMASFRLAPSSAQRNSASHKLLVDCSGSMAGDSIASARKALAHVAGQLRATDRFSYSRFGSGVVHGLRKLAPANATNLAMLQAMIAGTDADLGGTEMQPALASTFAIRGGDESGADVLLITDGEVWNADEMIDAARAARHRIFAIGVGSAPAESLLRRLAAATGGACEFATPGESLQAGVDRMLSRIRQRPLGRVRVEWRDAQDRVIEPAWTAGVPAAVFAGDTVHMAAGFADAAPSRARLVAEGFAGRDELASASIALRDDPSRTLCRMVAASRIAELPERDALALALEYQLVTRFTHLLLVHQRAEGAKATGFAELHRVPQMLAAGWGGTGTAVAAHLSMDSMAFCVADDSHPLYERVQRHRRDWDAQLLAMARSIGGPEATSLKAWLDLLDARDEIADCVDVITVAGLSRDIAFAAVIHWLVMQGRLDVPGTVADELQRRLGGLNADQWQGVIEAIERFPGLYGSDVRSALAL
jgi:Ca-activated chloride channel family protein